MFDFNNSEKNNNKVKQQEICSKFWKRCAVASSKDGKDVLGCTQHLLNRLRLSSENSVCAATHSFMVMHRGVRPPPTPSVLSASCGIMAASVACDSCMYTISDPAPVSCATSHTAAHVRPLMLDKCLFMYCMRAHVRACLEMRVLKTFDWNQSSLPSSSESDL